MSQRDCVNRKTACFKRNGVSRPAIVLQPGGVERHITVTDAIADRIAVGGRAAPEPAGSVVSNVVAAVDDNRRLVHGAVTTRGAVSQYAVGDRRRAAGPVVDATAVSGGRAVPGEGAVGDCQRVGTNIRDATACCERRIAGEGAVGNSQGAQIDADAAAAAEAAGRRVAGEGAVGDGCRRRAHTSSADAAAAAGYAGARPRVAGEGAVVDDQRAPISDASALDGRVAGDGAVGDSCRATRLVADIAAPPAAAVLLEMVRSW